MPNSPAPINLDALIARALTGNGFIVKTPPITKLFAEIKNLLTTGRQGGILWGRFRIGKTSATRWVLDAYQTTLGDIPYVLVPCRYKKAKNWPEPEFFQYLLECLKSNYAHSGKPGDKRYRLTEALLELGSSSQYKTVILFLDEAQFLGEMQFEWLVNVANELDAEGIRLFCMLVGNQELRGLPERLLEKKKVVVNGEHKLKDHEHIYGRFALQEMQIRGLRKRRDVIKFVSEYCSVIFPPQYKKPIISHFIPYAYSANKVPNNLGELIWDAFYDESVRVSNGEIVKIEIPMTYLCAAILQLLNILKTADGPNLVVTEADVAEAVKLSGYIPGLKNRDPQLDDLEEDEEAAPFEETPDSETSPDSTDGSKQGDDNATAEKSSPKPRRGRKRRVEASSDGAESAG